MITRLATLRDYHSFRKLWYSYLTELDEEWYLVPSGIVNVLNVDNYLDLLADQDNKLLLFRVDGIDFGFGFVTADRQGMLVYRTYFLPEFYDCFDMLTIGLSIGKVIGTIPALVSFDCNKQNLILKSGNSEKFVVVSDNALLDRMHKQVKQGLKQNIRELEAMFSEMQEGETRSSNTDIENEFHARKQDVAKTSIARTKKWIDRIRSIEY